MTHPFQHVPVHPDAGTAPRFGARGGLARAGRRGVRGGLAAPHASAPLAGVEPRRHVPTPAVTGYWSAAWIAALAVTVVLVFRMSELIPGFRVLRPAITVSAGVAALYALNVRQRVWLAALRRPELQATLIYGGVLALSVPFALWKGGAFTVVKAFPFMALIVVSHVLAAPTRRTLDRTLLAAVIAAAATAALVIATGQVEIDLVGGARIGTGGSYDPNDLGAMVSMTALLALGIAFRVRGLSRLAALGSLGVLMAVLLRTGSRGGFVAFAVGTAVLLGAQSWRRRLVLTLSIAIALPLALQFGPETFRVRALSIFTLESDYNLTERHGRIETWKRGLSYFVDAPILGVGAANYMTKEGQVNTANNIAGSWMTAHNTYVQILVELGLVGGVAFLYLLYRAGQGAFKAWRRPRASEPGRLHRPEVLAAFASFVVSAVFLSHAYNYLMFYAVALCALTSHVADVERGAVGGRRTAPR